MKSLACLVTLLLFLVLAPSVVTGLQTSEYSTNNLGEHEVWLDPLNSHVFSFECQAGDVLRGSFEITLDGGYYPGDQRKYDLWLGWGEGIDFYIFNNIDFDAWTNETSSIAFFSRSDVTELDWMVTLPSTGDWYIVYRNDSPVYGKEVKGAITLENPVFTVLYMLLLLGIVTALIVVPLVYRRKVK
jgi:hypothetical protein